MLATRTFADSQGSSYRTSRASGTPITSCFRSRGDASRRPIALVGHLDTVFPPGTFEGFKRDGDLARGPGVLDMKGGLVVVALRAPGARRDGRARRHRADAARDRRRRRGRLAGGAGRHPRGHRGRAGRARVRGRAQGRRHHHARKGTGAMTPIAHGKAAHAGNNHKEARTRSGRSRASSTARRSSPTTSAASPSTSA